MLWRQIYEPLWPGDASVVQHIKMWIIFKVIDHEEADTKTLLHALDATANSATELYIYSSDTNALVLPLRRYLELCVKTWFVAGMADNHCVIGLGPLSFKTSCNPVLCYFFPVM